MSESVNGLTNGRTNGCTNGRRLKSHPISSSRAFGSGELIKRHETELKWIKLL